jgi:D-xylose reductase
MPGSTVTLPSGHQMPLVGFGLWKVPADKAADTVYNAIKVGYRLFDGAYDYQNEKEAGEGIRRAIQDGLVKREDVFVTTKLWNNYHKRERKHFLVYSRGLQLMLYFSDALRFAKEQNDTWGLGYIDLYLMHFPIALKYVDPEKLKYPVSPEAV